VATIKADSDVITADSFFVGASGYGPDAMSLTVTFDGTNVATADSLTETNLGVWDNATITAAEAWTETKVQGTGSIGFQANNKDGWGAFDTSGEAITFDFTGGGANEGDHIYIWVFMSTPGTIEAPSVAEPNGLYVIVGSSTTAYHRFKVADASFTGQIVNGFARLVIDPTLTPSMTVGSPDLSAVDFIGMWVDTASSARADNLFIDRIDVGKGLIVTGTSSNFWEDVYQADMGNNSNVWGVLDKSSGNYVLRGGLTIGDSAEASASTAVLDTSGADVSFTNPVYALPQLSADSSGSDADTLTDVSADFSQVSVGDAIYNVTEDVWAAVTAVTSSTVLQTTAVTSWSGDSYVIWTSSVTPADIYYIKTEGSATYKTSLSLGTAVGTGDDRQGLQGGSIKTAGPGWLWDSQSNANQGTIGLYGVLLKGAEQGVDLYSAASTTLISCQLANCGAVDPGTVGGGAELLNLLILDPKGVTNNYGLIFNQTPSAGVLTHNCANIAFVTSGNPTTQYMVVLPYAGDYTISWNGFQFFGVYTSGTLWHGLNSGSNADVDISVVGANAASESEFSNTASGTVTISNDVNFSLANVVSGTTLYIEATAGGDLTAGDVIMGPLTISSDPYTATLPGAQPFIATLAHASGSPVYQPMIFQDTSGIGFSRRIEQILDS